MNADRKSIPEWQNVKTSFVGSTNDRTNPISTWLMDFAGNPYRVSGQDSLYPLQQANEPTNFPVFFTEIHCGRGAEVELVAFIFQSYAPELDSYPPSENLILEANFLPKTNVLLGIAGGVTTVKAPARCKPAYRISDCVDVLSFQVFIQIVRTSKLCAISKICWIAMGYEFFPRSSGKVSQP